MIKHYLGCALAALYLAVAVCGAIDAARHAADDLADLVEPECITDSCVGCIDDCTGDVTESGTDGQEPSPPHT